MEESRDEDSSSVNQLPTDRLSTSSGAYSCLSAHSYDSLRPQHSRPHSYLAGNSGKTSPGRKDWTPRSSLSWEMERVYTSGNSNRGFTGHPAIQTPRTYKAPHSALTTLHREPHILRSRSGKSSNPQLLLTGDGLMKSVAGQPYDLGGRAKMSPRSRSNLTPGGFETAIDRKNALRGKHCDACAAEYIRHDSSDSPRNKNPTVHEQNIRSSQVIAHILDQKRPKAAVKAFYQPLQLQPKKKGQKEENLLFTGAQRANTMTDYRLLKEPSSLHTVTVPKKGLIKLTSMAYELNNPMYYDDRQKIAQQREQQLHHQALYGSALSPSSRCQLIRNKSILSQIRQGQKLLENSAAFQDSRRFLDEDEMLNLLVGGILLYEIPDAPHLNKTLKRFVGGDKLNTSLKEQLLGQDKPSDDKI